MAAANKSCQYFKGVGHPVTFAAYGLPLSELENSAADLAAASRSRPANDAAKIQRAFAKAILALNELAAALGADAQPPPADPAPPAAAAHDAALPAPTAAAAPTPDVDAETTPAADADDEDEGADGEEWTAPRSFPTPTVCAARASSC